MQSRDSSQSLNPQTNPEPFSFSNMSFGEQNQSSSPPTDQNPVLKQISEQPDLDSPSFGHQSDDRPAQNSSPNQRSLSPGLLLRERSPNSQQALKSPGESGSVLDKILRRRQSQPRQRRSVIQEEAPEPASRIIIKRLVLENFKSYGGRHEIGPFHHHFNAIIGPNGSGKSNLIDSMVFVFGKRASKLRLKNLSELIHRGYNQEQASPQSTRVKIEFAEVGGEGQVEQEAFSVSREVNLRGASRYHLNGRVVKIDHIEQFFRRKGVDLANNRFIILQGEIEKISMMRPCSHDRDRPGLLEYLEDLIGSEQHVETIEQLEKELTVRNEERLRLGELSKTAFQEVKTLSGEKDRAIEFIKDERKQYQLQSLEVQVNRLKVVRYKRQNVQKKADLKEKWAEFQERIKLIRESNKRKEREIQALRGQLSQMHAKFAELKRALDATNTKYQNLLHNRELLDDRKQKQRHELARHAEAKQAARRQLDLDGSMVPELQANLDDLQGQERRVEARIREVEERNRERILELKQTERALVKKADKGARDQEKLEREGAQLMEEEMTLKKELADNQAKREQHQSRASELEQAKEAEQKKVRELADVLEKLRGCEDGLREELRQTDKQLDELGGRARDIDQKLKKIDMVNSTRRYSQKVLAHLMDLQREGQLLGIMGRLGDLGAIDSKFDMAASTATGLLDFIVVDSYDNAKRCIQMLKSRRIGKASFLTLDRLKDMARFMEMPKRFPKNTQRLFDLIGRDRPNPSMRQPAGQTGFLQGLSGHARGQ